MSPLRLLGLVLLSVLLAGARLAVAQPCSPEDRDVPEGGVSVVDVSAATPTPVLLATDPADGMAGGVALNATQVAVRTPAEAEVADSATGAAQRTVPTSVTGELGPTTPVALAEDGTIFTASPAAIPDEGAGPPRGELSDRIDPAEVLGKCAVRRRSPRPSASAKPTSPAA